jgi:hypothetical protein
MTPREATPTEAKHSLRAYRAPHRIIPMSDPRDPLYDWVCACDGVPIYRVKNGWRHKSSEVRVLAEQAPIPEVGEYR